MEINFISLVKKSYASRPIHNEVSVGSQLEENHKATKLKKNNNNKTKQNKRFPVDSLHRNFQSENANSPTVSYAEFVPCGL